MKPIPLICSTVLLAGCAGEFTQPQLNRAVTDRYSAPVPQAATTPDQNWWAQFNDDGLNHLLALAYENSPSLQSAAARVVMARASETQSGAGELPSVNADANSTVAGQENTRRSTSHQAGLTASWELDLFAKASSQTRASERRARASEVAYGGAYTSLSAEVADSYVRYRACRQRERVYRQVLASQRETERATGSLVNAGLSTSGDLSLARANAANATVQLENTKADCRIIAQSLTVSTGTTQAQVDEILARGSRLPSPQSFRVSSVPADLLRQRPDIVEAELEFAARVAEIRAARADLYPSLSLSGTLTAAGTNSWSFGPVLNLPIFDGGARRANVVRAQANADLAVQDYRAAVLAGVAEVEGALTRLDTARRTQGQSQRALNNLRAYFETVDANWQAGGESLLNREDARRQYQNAEITVISIREDRLRQWITLYRAMGGGWQGNSAATGENQ